MDRIVKEEKPKTTSEWEIELERLQAILRDQSRRLAKELGLAGDPLVLFMLMSGILSIAWASFAIKSSSVDEQRPFDQRIELLDLLAGMSSGLTSVVEKASDYADVYKK